MDYLGRNKEQDNNLKNELYRLKENLQEKYFNINTNRKPAICAEEVIENLAKYKPTTVEDLRKIKGIGNNFIENYGEDFIKVIKKYINENKISLENNEKSIMQKLENRLININRRNRLLYSSKVNKDYGVDIFTILGNVAEFIEFILKRSTSKYKVLDIKNFDDNKFKVLLKIIRQVNKNINETGNNELYVAYPFAQGKMENEEFNIKAPLMLFPVEIIRDKESISLRNDFSRDIIYNTHLILANNKFNGRNEVLPNNEIEEYDSVHFLDNMIDFYSENHFYIQKSNFKPEKYFENKLNEFPKYKNGEIELKGYIILGIYSMYTTSMYSDFNKMIENSEITELIKELLIGCEAETSANLYDEMDESKIDSQDKIENEIYYINELDFSQEKVLKEIQNTNSLVVQGPPGTGKSQTITSVIVQSILDNKKVLMVSEKKTALDVIYSRLGKLSKFAIIIDDVENKDLFYKQLDKITTFEDSKEIWYNENLAEFNKNIDNERNNLKRYIDNINNDIDKLNQIAKKIYSVNDFGTSYYNLYNICKKIDTENRNEFELYSFVNSNLTDNIRNTKYQELNEILTFFNVKENINSIYEYLKVINEVPFVLNIKSNLTEIELLELKKEITELIKYKEEFENYNKFKQFINKSKLTKFAIKIMDNYFYDQILKEDILNNLKFLYDFITNSYNSFFTYKYLFDKLNLTSADYANVIYKVKEKFNNSYDLSEINKKIYNVIIYNKISIFERDNWCVLNYVNNFDSIIKEIHLNIIKKKEITKKFAYLNLIRNNLKLNDNGKISKIEELCNRKRKMAINKFMDKFKFEMSDSIRIWLMTPEVVSDVFSFEKNMFDLVIFDEASQLYVEKAIPAIYRAKKVLVAGDQMQLKPSSLGKGRILDEVDEDEMNDGFLEYESLLDAARYKYKHTMLNYHYRSKYAELISFSNYAFYGRKLLVTSSPNKSSERPIERIIVKDGRWIDKKNVKEAEEVVRLIKKILRERKNNETIGVITFNISQMNLIEDYIEKEKMLDEKFLVEITNEEQRTSNGENIGFFIKNIESVQGDERDIIIFCIGYAKNENERVAINFGWLNQDGGENRLNVAISRAKSKIYVVTSIEPEELIVDNTKNNGPKLFKEYLKYVKAVSEDNKEMAEGILLSLLDNKESENDQLSYDSVFEEEVCNKLIEEGYNIGTQYGVGGYRIDIVIKSKDGKDVLLGVECDGRLYHSSKFARERDYHRQKYLESRGWKIYRIWSTNWWKNPDLEMKKLKTYIDTIKSK